MNQKKAPGSFRDPSGFIFWQGKELFRQINYSYQENYDFLTSSGLYQELVNKKLLIPHQEASLPSRKPAKAYKIIKPQIIPFVSYPYEWSFSQLKKAALATLKIQRIALGFKMSLKDASAYNIQFLKNQPILIDTLSFEKHQKGSPWIAYRQFCRHFFAPLALMAKIDIRLNQLLRSYLDGLPLDLASCLLSFRSFLKPSLFSHLFLHAKTQKHFAAKKSKITKTHQLSHLSLIALIDHLESSVKKLNWRPQGTQWADYNERESYSPEAFKHKEKVVVDFLKKIKPKTVWDLGANLGRFSRLAAQKANLVVSFDLDPAAVEKNYLQCLSEKNSKILPLLLDLTNPSPGLGWQNQERASLLNRGPADSVLALALIHHLAISHNLPFAKIAEFLSFLSPWLIIEFIPKNDPQAAKLFLSREDIFPDYQEKAFEKEFSQFFEIKKKTSLKNSQRSLFLMKKR